MDSNSSFCAGCVTFVLLIYMSVSEHNNFQTFQTIICCAYIRPAIRHNAYTRLYIYEELLIFELFKI